eukprot:GHVU01031006.1.p1 GENE.GHVU01031006.1~~GHVU01031006.1.p1  ORF type:complete len:240 (-),score=26.03 GHVU01031006.1:430-1149(-)
MTDHVPLMTDFHPLPEPMTSYSLQMIIKENKIVIIFGIIVIQKVDGLIRLRKCGSGPLTPSPPSNRVLSEQQNEKQKREIMAASFIIILFISVIYACKGESADSSEDNILEAIKEKDKALTKLYGETVPKHVGYAEIKALRQGLSDIRKRIRELDVPDSELEFNSKKQDEHEDNINEAERAIWKIERLQGQRDRMLNDTPRKKVSGERGGITKLYPIYLSDIHSSRHMRMGHKAKSHRL